MCGVAQRREQRGIGAGQPDLAFQAQQGSEKRIDLLKRIAGDGHRMVYNQDGRLLKVEQQLLLDLLAAEQGAPAQMV